MEYLIELNKMCSMSIKEARMSKEQENAKEMFHQAIIGGYKKKEVEEYIYFLINEVENLKAENASSMKEQKKELEKKSQELQEKDEELSEKMIL